MTSLETVCYFDYSLPLRHSQLLLSITKSRGISISMCAYYHTMFASMGVLSDEKLIGHENQWIYWIS